MGKLKNNIAKNDTLYLIVIGEVWNKIVLGDKRIEYRERTDYWDKRILNKQYKYMRITNGYGNDTRPYRLYQYTGATRVMKDSIQCFAIFRRPARFVHTYTRLPHKFAQTPLPVATTTPNDTRRRNDARSNSNR